VLNFRMLVAAVVLVSAALLTAQARPGQGQEQERVQAISPPATPLPPEAASAGVTKYSFIAYGDTRGRRDGVAIQYEHSLIVDSMLAQIKKLQTTDYPVRFILQSGDAVVHGQIAARQVGLTVLAARPAYGLRDSVLHFGRGIVGEGVAEVLHDEEAVSAANYAQADDVIGRVEQVGAMRRGEHEVFVAIGGVVVEGDVFALLIELELRRSGEAYRQGRLAIELVGELIGF